MERFAKVFKNVTVLLRNGKTQEIARIGFSVRLNLQESTVELYREEGRLTQEGSSSKGFRKRISYRGSPDIDGIYRLIALRSEGGKVPLMRKTEVHIREEAFGAFTEKVLFYQISYNYTQGTLLKEDLLNGERKEICALRPVNRLEDFLEITQELWTVIDKEDIVG